MSTTTLGIDLGKRWFHVVGRDAAGHVSHRQRFNRTQLIEFVARHPSCLIGMETCCGSQYLARKFLAFGHDVKLLPAQYVKPFVKSQKNDFNDADTQSGFDLIPKGTLVPVRMTIKPGGFDEPAQGWTGGYATQSFETGAVYLSAEFVVTGAHNTWLEVLFDLGLLGLASALAMVFAFARAFARASGSTDDDARFIGRYGVIFGCMLLSQTMFTQLIKNVTPFFWFFLVCGFLARRFGHASAPASALSEL